MTMNRCGAYLALLLAVLAVSGEKTSEFHTRGSTKFPWIRTSTTSHREAPAESEGSRSDGETLEDTDRHHSWAQATAEDAVSAAILDWRLISNLYLNRRLLTLGQVSRCLLLVLLFTGQG